MKMTPVNSFDKVGSLEEMGKRRKRSQMTGGGMPVAEDIRDDIICVEDAASPQGLESLRYYHGLWPFQAQP